MTATMFQCLVVNIDIHNDVNIESSVLEYKILTDIGNIVYQYDL